jgi:hypothetical protein
MRERPGRRLDGEVVAVLFGNGSSRRKLEGEEENWRRCLGEEVLGFVLVYLLGLQVQRFVEQQQVSLKWITQGLSNSGRLEVKAIPLKQAWIGKTSATSRFAT